MKHFAMPARRHFFPLFAMVSLFASIVFFGTDPFAVSGAYAVEIREIQVGIDGYYKTGVWTPITVSWDGEGSEQVFRIDVRTFDSDGTPVRSRHERFICFSKTAQGGSAVVYAKPGRAADELCIELFDRETLLARRRIRPEKVEIRGHARANNALNSSGVRFFSPVPQERPIYLVLGNSDSGLQDAVSLLRLKESQRPVIVQIDSLEKLPPDHDGLDGVELIVLTTTQTGMWDAHRASDPVMTAMYDWMNFGGQILFLPGKSSEPFLADPDAPLAPFLPGRFERMVELRQGKPLELYAGSNRSVIMEGNEVAPYIKMPFISGIRGTVELSEADLPLVVKKPVGFGSLIYFGGDLADPPLSDWRDRGLFLLKLLNWDTDRLETAAGQHSLVHLGFHDLSGQIRSALDRFEGVSVLPFSLVLVLIVLYVVVIAPLDWLLVHRLLKRPQWTWLTFPLGIAFFCCLAFVLNKSNREMPLAVNSVDLLDFAPEERLVRVHTWGSVFSPKDDRYELALTTGAPNTTEAKEECRLHWLGLSGGALGGMDPKTVSLTSWNEPYEFSDREPGKLVDVPVRVRSTKSFFGRWNSDFHRRRRISPPSLTEPGAEPGTKFERESENHGSEERLFEDLRFHAHEGIPHGTFTNKFPVALENVLVVYGFWVLKIGRLPSGASVELGTQTTRRELRMILNSTAAGFDENQLTGGVGNTYSYNMESREFWPILRTMSFFKAFGGFDSVGLHNAIHAKLDLSDSVRTGRAVLVAEMNPESLSLSPFQNRLEVRSADSTADFSGTAAESSEIKPDAPPGKHACVVRILIPVDER